MSCSWRPHCYNTNLFSSNLFLQDQLLLEEIIPNMVNDSINNLVTLLPSKEEIKNAVFYLTKDVAPGLDGFRACFFQT